MTETSAFHTDRPDRWTRKQTHPGTEFRAVKGRVVVELIEWQKPGFRNVTSRGWVIQVDGTQLGAAHQTATRAMRHAELPGVWPEIERMLADHAATDPTLAR